MKGVLTLNTVESLYRFYKKVGPVSFETFIKEHPEFSEYVKSVKALEKHYAKTLV